MEISKIFFPQKFGRIFYLPTFLHVLLGSHRPHDPASLVTWWGRVRSSFASGSKKRRFTSFRWSNRRGEPAQPRLRQVFQTQEKFQIDNMYFTSIKDEKHTIAIMVWKNKLGTYIWLVWGEYLVDEFQGCDSIRWVRLKRFQNNVSATMQFQKHPSELQEPPCFTIVVPIGSTWILTFGWS